MVKRTVGRGYIFIEKQIIHAYKKADLKKPSKKVIRDTIDKILSGKKIRIKKRRRNHARQKKPIHK